MPKGYLPAITAISMIVIAFMTMLPTNALSGSANLAAGDHTARVKGSSGETPPIRLKAITFTPANGEQPDIPAQLRIFEYQPGDRSYYIVQFDGPIEESWKDDVEALGAEIADYIPEFAFKVRMNPGQARKVEQLARVTAVVPFQPAYKLSPDLVRGGKQLYGIHVEPIADAELVAVEIAGQGSRVLARRENVLMVAADAGQLDAIAHLDDVAWIENFVLPEKHNEYGAGAIMGAGTANSNGYDGSTQIVAVADTGLGDGTKAGAHPDIPSSRIVQIYDRSLADDADCYDIVPNAAQDVESGHGTHVTGSVLSDGGPNGEGKGTAPSARLLFQAVEEYVTWVGTCDSYLDGYQLVGLWGNVRDLFHQAYSAGARIHSNSWGSDAYGDYNADSANTDEFIWNHPDMTMTFSAGNYGQDADGDGIIDSGSLASPATAKNVIAVGASENDRQGHYECDTSLIYEGKQVCRGQNSVGGQAGNAQQMASFSSRGPTDDGRIKPDVVAPGTWVLSSYSDLYQQGYDGSSNPQNNAWQDDGWGYPLNDDYKYSGGTSMSNPLVAGAAAVVRDYYNKAHGHNASAALTKATLINSAVDILDENNDGRNDNDYPIPNAHEGWGRVDVAGATDGSHEFIDDATGLRTGGTASHTFGVSESGSPFKVSLVWSDYPSTKTAAKNLVNDLELIVTAPDGTVYGGNVFTGGWSQPGGVLDQTNNVENVYIKSAAAGTWTVEVRGYNVPYGPQPFAVVVDGNLGEVAPAPTPTPTPTPSPTPTPTPTPTPAPSPAAALSAPVPSTNDYEAFDRTWARTDYPVQELKANRTWMWGDRASSGPLLEEYAESPGGQRTVKYFDKSRMEVSNPDAVDDGLWYVTNGLLVKELITGEMQIGNAAYEQRAPAQVNVAGDPETGPTYAVLDPLRSAIPLGEGAVITQRLHADGSLSADSGLAGRNILAGHLVEATNHTVAQPFWEFMNSSGTVFENGQLVETALFQNPFYATGFPITEAYWTTVTVAGTPKDVLIQCFERRCLTYTPDNPAGWQVEAGNVGRHYYEWRYGQMP